MNLKNKVLKEQNIVCSKIATPLFKCGFDQIIGVSRNIIKGETPIHGLRHNPEGDESGWYLWAGEYSEKDDFFIPVHVSHLLEWRPEVIKYLGLPPSYRFIWDIDYEEIWRDESLL